MRTPAPRSARLGALAMVVALGLGVAASPTADAAQTHRGGSTYTTKKLSSPARTLVYNSAGKLVATFTNGARTVTLLGPSRTFSEPANTTATVTTTTWVRLLSSPFSGTLDTAWLTARLADTSPDVLALSMQYIAGAPSILNGSGLRIAGDADYGPLSTDGTTRLEGSDFNDYLGVSWSYPSGTVDAPEPDQIGALDCSGYVRMLFGYRSGLPMTLSPDGVRLPRRAFEMAASAPGVTVIPNTGVVPTSRTLLLPGDLVFFDADTGDGTQIDHVGIFLGRDNAGHDRFISSRKTVNGPTLSDVGARSYLDGTGFYASAFRSTRRL